MRRAQQQTISFPLYDSTVTTGVTKSGLALLASDVKLSKDGGAFASATNPPTEIGSTGRYALVLTAAETACGWFHLYVEKAGARPQDVFGEMSDQPDAKVVSGDATTFVTNLTESANDFWKGAGVTFTSGALRGQVREVAGYNGSTKALTLAVPLTAAPATDDRFVIDNS